MYMCVYIYITIVYYSILYYYIILFGDRARLAGHSGARGLHLRDHDEAVRAPRNSKAPKGNGIGATGSKNLGLVLRPACMLEPLFFSARHGSKNLGLVLRPLCPYTVALRGVD